jgi:hypothetical protein
VAGGLKVCFFLFFRLELLNQVLSLPNSPRCERYLNWIEILDRPRRIGFRRPFIATIFAGRVVGWPLRSTCNHHNINYLQA